MEEDNVYLAIDGKVVRTAKEVTEINLSNISEFGNIEDVDLPNNVDGDIIMDIKESDKELRIKHILSIGDFNFNKIQGINYYMGRNR